MVAGGGMITADASKVVDREAFLDRLGGDEDLAQQLVTLLLRDLPQLTGAVAKAVGERHAYALERSAHALKGAVANFSAAPAVAAAQHLESMGRNNDLQGCDEAQAKLQAELLRLAEALPKLFARGTS